MLLYPKSTESAASLKGCRASGRGNSSIFDWRLGSTNLLLPVLVEREKLPSERKKNFLQRQNHVKGRSSTLV